MDLQGKTALITGGTTGIGFATAGLFRKAGARVAITGQDEGRLARAGEALGPDSVTILADAGSVASADHIAGRIAAAFGRLDILYLNAGIAPRANLAEIDEEKFDRMFTINVKGVLFPVQKLERLMPDGASIIVTTSINNRIGMIGTHLYGASKAAARSLVRSLAGELAPRRIRVNAISPGPVATEIAGKLDLSEGEMRALGEVAIARMPLKRVADADEIGRIALFLASDASSIITGAEIMADGGWVDIAP